MKIARRFAHASAPVPEGAAPLVGGFRAVARGIGGFTPVNDEAARPDAGRGRRRTRPKDMAPRDG